MGSMVEAIVLMALAVPLMIYVLEIQQRLGLESEMRVSASVVGPLHAAAERYLRERYVDLEECLDAGTVPDPGEGDAVWVAVPLYGEAAAIPAILGGGCPNAAVTDLDTFFEAGLLPSALWGLSYSAGSEDTEVWRGMVIRFVVRRVGFGPEEFGLQGLLVLRGSGGVAIPMGEAQLVARESANASVGVLASHRPDNAVRVRGPGGGWMLFACAAPPVPAALGAVGACPTADADWPGIANPYRAIEVLDYPHAGTGALARALRGAGSQERLSGGALGERETGIVVATVALAREAALRSVLYADDIGVPEANRMRTVIDAGGYGMVNVAVLVGPDVDGDAYPDEGPHVVGPPPGSGDPPIVLDGDVMITGNLVVGRSALPGTALPAAANAGVVLASRLQLSGAAVDFDADLVAGAARIDEAVHVGGTGYDTGLVSGAVLAEHSVQAGTGGYDAVLGADAAGSVYARNSAQVGGAAFDGALDAGAMYAVHAVQSGGSRYAVPAAGAGALLGVGEARIGGGLRVVGPQLHATLNAGAALAPAVVDGWSGVGTLQGDVRPGVPRLILAGAGGAGAVPGVTDVGGVVDFADSDVYVSRLSYASRLGDVSPTGRFSGASLNRSLESALGRFVVDAREVGALGASGTSLTPATLGCPAGSTPELVAAPTGWRASQALGPYYVRFGLEVQGHGRGDVNLGPFYVPYVGWGVHPRTGAPNSIGVSGSVQTRATVLGLCRWD